MAISAHLIQTSLNGGEVSRRLQSRVDTSIYKIAAGEITNGIATVEGPVVKTPGSRFRALALETAGWLGKFVYNATQAYLIEYSDLKIRFLTNDALLESPPGTPVEVVTPYTAAEAPLISTTQSGDVLYMAAAGHAPAALSRTGAAAFNHAALALTGGPFKDQNTEEAITVTASGTTGSVTVTAGSAIFLAGHVGGLLRLEAKDFSTIAAWEAGIDGIAIGNIRRSDDKAYTAASSGRTGSIQPTHVRGTEYDGMAAGTDVNGKGPFGVQWTYRHDRFGYGVITAIGGGGTTATVTVLRRLPDSVTSVATHRWALGAFSAAEGWPHLVFKWKGRLGFISQLSDGFWLDLSVAGSYRDFAELDESGVPQPDQAIRARIDTSDPILWVKPGTNDLLLGTNLGEHRIHKVNPAEPLSASNIEIDPTTHHGSAPVEPLQIGGVTVFAQRGGRKLRASDYEFANDRYNAPNFTIWARQITRGGVIQLAHQAEPEELLWALRADGRIVAHAYMPDQEVKGFSTGKAMEGAEILSIQAMPSTDGTRDDLWMLVSRTLGDGETVLRSHECLDRWWDEDEGRAVADACFVDGALSFDGDPATIFTGFDHLDGLPAMVLADGAEVTGLTFGPVTGGIGFVIDSAPSKVTGGIGYTARVTTLRPEVPRPDGTSQGRLKKIVSVILRVIDTFGIRAGPIGGTLENVFDRQPTDPMNGGPSLYNGDSDPQSAGGSWGSGGEVTIESRSPFPWILGAVVSGLEEGGR